MHLLIAVALAPDLAAEVTRTVDAQECRSAAGSQELVVCADRRASQRYRIEQPSSFDPAGSTESVARERSRWIEEGDTGIQSCSAVGPGGWTGCAVKQWKRGRQQYRGWYG